MRKKIGDAINCSISYFNILLSIKLPFYACYFNAYKKSLLSIRSE